MRNITKQIKFPQAAFMLLALFLIMRVEIVFSQTGGEILNGKAKSLVTPVYPAGAAKSGASGEVKISITLDEAGKVLTAKAVSGDTRLRAAAVAAAMQTKFYPQIVNGKAVKISGILIFDFVAPTTTSVSDKPSNQSIEKALNGAFKGETDFSYLIKYSDADALIFTGLIDKPDFASDVYAQRARAFFSMEKIDEALADAEKSLDLNPKNIEALNVRGLVSQVREQFDAAIKDYSQAIALDPKFIKAYLNRGNSYLLKKDLTAAAADFRQVQEIDPGNQPASQMLKKIAAVQPPATPNQSNPSQSAAAEPRKNFIARNAEFNALRKIYAEKLDAYSPLSDKESARFGRNIDPTYQKTAADIATRTAYCKALLELDPAITDVLKIAALLQEMDKSGEAAKAASAEELAAMRANLKQLNLLEIYRPNTIFVDECRANPAAEELSLDDIVKTVNRDNQQSLVKIMLKLDNFTGYLTSAKKMGAIKFQTAPASEICSAVLEFKKESDAIEPDLKAFVKLYQFDTPPDYDDPAHPARLVRFDDPNITERAEKTLSLYHKLFLPKKEAIQNTIGKYGCK